MGDLACIRAVNVAGGQLGVLRYELILDGFHEVGFRGVGIKVFVVSAGGVGTLDRL